MADDSWISVANLHTEGADGESLVEKAADFVSKGVPLALASGVTSIVNTAASFGNMFGADIEKVDFREKVKAYDDDLTKYYDEHREGVELGGFIATSFAPGMLGMKGLKALQSLKDAEGIGRATRSVAGYFSSRQEKYLELAAKTIQDPTQRVFSLIDKNKLLAIANGFGEQAMQGAAFETAVLLTMNQNPVLEPGDRDNYITNVWNHVPQAGWNAVLAGGVGGAISGVITHGQIKRLIKAEDEKLFPTIYAYRPGETNLNPGDLLAHDFSIMKDMKETLEKMKSDLQAGGASVEDILSQKAIISQTTTLKNFENEFDLFITKKLVNDTSPELAEELRNAVKSITRADENGYPIQTDELVARVFGGAKSARLLGDISGVKAELSEFTQFHGSPDVIVGGFKNDVRGSVYNIIGPGAYTTNDVDIGRLYMNRPGAKNPTLYGFKEKPGANIPLYDIDQPITDEIKQVIRSINHAYPDYIANFGELDKAKTLQEFYLTASKKSFGEGKLPPSQMSDAFQAIREYFENLGYRGLTHKGGILGGKEHKVKIYWYPENDTIIKKIPKGAKIADVDGLLTHFVPNTNERIVKLSGTDKGNIVDKAYPAPGDTGKIEFKKNELFVDGYKKEVSLIYEPDKNTPTESSFQFLKQKFSPRLAEGDVIPFDNLPLLEKAAMEDMQGLVTVEGRAADDNLMGLLRLAKMEALVKLKNAGKDLDYISRALNVPKDFIDNPQTGALTLYTLEDHTKPLYAKMNYQSRKQMDTYEAEGLLQVQKNLKIATTQREAAAAYLFGREIDNFVRPTGSLKGVTTISGGSGALTSADAARGSTMMTAMQAGNRVNKIAAQQATDWQNALYSLRQEIKNDPKALYERNINAGKLRASDEDMIRLPAEFHPGGDEKELILMPKSIVMMAYKEKDPVGFIQNKLNLAPQVMVRAPIESLEARYLITRQELTGTQAKKWNVANAARGSRSQINEEAFYEPPIDTTRQPYFVMVRYNNPLDDLRPQSMIVAQTPQALQDKIAQIKAAFGDTLEVFTKDDIKQNKQLAGTYDSGMLFGKTDVDSKLKREGILSDFIPRKDAYIFDEEDQWIWRQAQAITRQGVELLYGAEIAELRFLANNWDKYYSRFGSEFLEKAKNPYTQVINTFMNVSNKSVYQAFWGKLNEGTQAAWNQMTGLWRESYEKVKTGELTPQQAEKIAQQAGYTAPFGKVAEEVFRESFKDQNSLSKLVSKINLTVGTLMIRMDPLNSLINTMSLPVLLSAETSAVRREIQKKLGLSVKVPGTQHEIPTMMSMLMDGTKAYWNKATEVIDGKTTNLKDFFTEIGAIKTNIQQIQDTLAIPLSAVKSGEATAVEYGNKLFATIGEAGAKVTGNNLAETFVRYQAAYAGLQLAKAQGITSRGELAAYINLMVNRVHGNYLASQRPTIFSGPVGQAISLFQTYQFNMIQQMTRYLQEGNYKSATVGLAMQNSIFGLQGNPLFWQLNQYIGNSNTDHGDIVSGTASVIGTGGGWNDPAKWLLYGLGANALQVNLYNRGDLTPRYTTVVPTNFQDVPAISIGTKAIGSFLDTAKAIANGAPIAESILHGVAHAGFNRPLAGLASIIAGEKTTNSGTLLASYNDLVSFTTAAKLAGGEPLNNAIAIDAYHRLQGYRTAQAQRMAQLAEAVKLTNSSGGGIDPEQTERFMQEYASKGGDIKQFNRFMINATRNSEQSIVNRMKQKTQSPMAMKSLSWLGADLEDYQNTPREEEQETSQP